jgi:hypothetical protein
MVSEKKIVMGISNRVPFGGMILGWPPSKCVRCSRLPTKMAAKLKIEKRGDENGFRQEYFYGNFPYGPMLN